MEPLQKEIRGGPLINVDETLQVLKEPGRRNKRKSYMGLYRGGAPSCWTARTGCLPDTREAPKPVPYFLV